MHSSWPGLAALGQRLHCASQTCNQDGSWGASGQGALQNTHPNAPLPPLGRGGLGVLWGTRRSSEDSAAPAGAVGWGSAGCPWLCRAEMLPARGFSEAAVGSRTAGAELGCKPACFWSPGPSYSLVHPEMSRLTLADLRPNRSSPCCSSPHSERQQRRLSGGAHNLPEQTRGALLTQVPGAKPTAGSWAALPCSTPATGASTALPDPSGRGRAGSDRVKG